MTGSGIRRTGTTSSPWLGDSSRNRANQTSTRTPGPGVSNLTAPYTGDSGCPCLPPLVAVGPGIPPFFPHILVWGSSFLCLIPLLPLLRSSHTPLISHTTHLTPLILHYSSHTTHHTPLHLTPLITHTTHHTHHSSHTTHHTPLITHHSISHHSSHTPLITHHSISHHSSLTPLITHHSSHTTHLTPLTRSVRGSGGCLVGSGNRSRSGSVRGSGGCLVGSGRLWSGVGAGDAVPL